MRRLGFVLRTALEVAEDGGEHVVLRGTNLAGDSDDSIEPFGGVTQRPQRPVPTRRTPGIVRLSQPAHPQVVRRPVPVFPLAERIDSAPEDPLLDEATVDELANGAVCRVLRLPGSDGEWIPLHLTLSRVKIDRGIYGGLVTVRLPSARELAEAGLEPPAAAGD